MIRVAIVDDEAAERARIRECLGCLAEEDHLEFDVEEYPSGLAFLMGKMSGYDIVLMDVDMPDMNGIETAHQLRKVDQSAVLVFVTNMAQYAVSGYEVDALDFIIKPINRYSFTLKMRRAVSRTAQQTDDVLNVKSGGTLHRVPISSIHYLEVSGHHVTYHTSAGELTEYSTLKEVRQRIPQRGFAQCSQSYLVNLRYVTSISREKIVVDGTEIFISRKMRQSFLTAVTEFCGGGSV